MKDPIKKYSQWYDSLPGSGKDLVVGILVVGGGVVFFLFIFLTLGNVDRNPKYDNEAIIYQECIDRNMELYREMINSNYENYEFKAYPCENLIK